MKNNEIERCNIPACRKQLPAVCDSPSSANCIPKLLTGISKKCATECELAYPNGRKFRCQDLTCKTRAVLKDNDCLENSNLMLDKSAIIFERPHLKEI